MSDEPCADCQKILDRETNLRHAGLERAGVHQSVGHHGNRDDERYYRCKVCGSTFIGDSCGTWPAND